MQIVHLGEGGYHIFCRAEIEGLEVNALIDTGANKSVLSTELAEKLQHLEAVELEENHTAGIGKEEVETSFVKLHSLQIGDLVIQDLLMGLLDLEHVEEMYRQMEIEPFNLIIGGDILQEYKASINYKNSELRLRT